MRFSGRVAIVTGSGRGIGRATALRLAAEGAAVVVADIDASSGEETAAEARAAGAEALFVETDVTAEEQVARLVEAAVSHYGRLDFAHNNAGGPTSSPVPTAELLSEDWRATLALNLDAAFFLLKYELTAMLPRGGGVIVATASGDGQHPAPGRQAYAAAKHGVIGLYRSAAAEYGTVGMRINVVSPGPTLTGLMEQYLASDPDLREERLARMLRASGRLAQPEEIAAAVAWVFSDEASFVNGAVVPVDGGRLS
jgi:NAD(P)-dependent dehydrogenase (short-subunit alcohol dehydrogenase family)